MYVHVCTYYAYMSSMFHEYLLGENIEMSWSCGHHGYINTDWLRKHQYPDANKKTSTNSELNVAVSDINQRPLLSQSRVIISGVYFN